MNSRRFCALAICLILAQSSAFSDEMKPLRDLGRRALYALKEHQDQDARRYFDEFLQKVTTTPGAVNDPQIELMMGALGCALPEHRESELKMGRIYLGHVRDRAKDKDQIRIATQLLRGCTALSGAEIPEATTLSPVLASVSNEVPGVAGTTKGGDPWRWPVANVAISNIDASQLEKRLEETRNPATALASTLARFGSGAQGTVTDHFIVATDYGGTKHAEGIAACLDRYRVDLSKEFDMVFPDHLITVYNTQWGDRVYQEAGQLHGLRLAPGTLAYSVYADLSMVGVASPQACGSLGHELTHLMIKGNFGDAPAWLEEGLASAVALSIPEDNHFSFRPGWRDGVLRSNKDMHLTVQQLLDFTWADFSPADSAGLPKAAAIQAMASVFVRYLAAKNKLQSVYFAVRKQNLLADLDHYRTPRQIVEDQLGKNMVDVDKDFAGWFGKQAREGRTSTTKPCTPSVNRHPVEQAPAPCEPEAKKRLH